LDFEVFFSVILNALRVACICVTIAFADFVVVCVITVAALTKVLTKSFLLGKLVLGVGVDEVGHVHDVLATSRAGRRRTAGGWTNGKLHQVLHVQAVEGPVLGSFLFSSDLDERRATNVTQTVIVEFIEVVVVVRKNTSRLNNTCGLHQLAAERRVEIHITSGSKRLGCYSRSEKAEKGSAEHHLGLK
jgi:hypothetical protein